MDCTELDVEVIVADDYLTEAQIEAEIEAAVAARLANCRAHVDAAWRHARAANHDAHVDEWWDHDMPF